MTKENALVLRFFLCPSRGVPRELLGSGERSGVPRELLGSGGTEGDNQWHQRARRETKERQRRELEDRKQKWKRERSESFEKALVRMCEKHMQRGWPGWEEQV
jgi:hypothetical protein